MKLKFCVIYIYLKYVIQFIQINVDFKFLSDETLDFWH
jgi:hypothetical protein